MIHKYMRNPAVVLICKKKICIFLREGVAPFALHDTNTSAVSWLMQAAARPITENEVDSFVGNSVRAALVKHKILLHAPEPVLNLARGNRATGDKPCNRLILGLTGAIATLKMVPIALDLKSQLAHEVDLILTSDAQSFVKPEAFTYLGLRVWTDTFKPIHGANVPHIHLAASADMVVVMPASAHTIHKIAQGACSDLLSLTISATRAPVILFPAMNGAMWDSPAVSRNVKQLREDGFYVVEPEPGGEVSNSNEQPESYGVAGWGGIGFVEILKRFITAHAEQAC